jgi:hypothetical protein
MHRAAEEKTEISYQLAEKEELLFFLSQKISKVSFPSRNSSYALPSVS